MDRGRRIGAGLAIVCVLAAGPAAALTIDNGLAPPNPANVITSPLFESLEVRDGGCAGQPMPCPSPGSPTTVEVQAGVDGGLSVYDASSAIVLSGPIPSIEAYNDSHIEVGRSQFGVSFGAIVGHDQASLLVGGGTGVGGLGIRLFGSSSLTLTGGFAESIVLNDFSTAWLTGGDSFYGVSVNDGATAYISGGTYGGSGGQLVASRDGGLLVWSGGYIFSDLAASNGGVIQIVGTDFEVNGVPVGYGVVSDAFGGLTGTLAGGESIANLFSLSSGGTIVLVPEPSTALLLGGGLALLGLRRRRTG